MTNNRQCKCAARSLLFVWCLLLLSCSGGDGDGQGMNSNIYLVGSSMINDVSVPVYWEGETIHELSRIDSSCAGYANAIVVEGGDIHIAGTTFECGGAGSSAKPVAAYWKNGVRTDLERPASHAQDASEAQQLILANGDVYIAGYVTGDHGPLAVYWHNGRLVSLNELPYGGTRARASNIYVDGSDVYVSGAVLFDSPFPVYWKNGEVFPLPIPSGYRGGQRSPAHLRGGGNRLRTGTPAAETNGDQLGYLRATRLLEERHAGSAFPFERGCRVFLWWHPIQ